MKSSMNARGKSGLGIQLARVCGLTFVVVMLLCVFLVAFFTIPTSSMSPCLIPGDVIIVNKLVPGPRLPGLTRGNSAYRLRGYSSLKRKDILVFNAPYHHSHKIAANPQTYYVKRCIGLPGDTLSLKSGIYHLRTAAGSRTIPPYRKTMPNDAWMDTFQSGMFEPLGWTLRNMGSIYIPAKDDCIRLNSQNIAYYQRLIEYETGQHLYRVDDQYFLGTKPYPKHCFAQNYYFVAGDRNIDSEDSRYWGLLPEGHIVGKVALIWKSVDPITGKFRFERLLKFVDNS